MDWKKALEHYGHDIEVARYGNARVGVVNVSIECVRCGEVIVDADTEGNAPAWVEETDAGGRIVG